MKTILLMMLRNGPRFKRFFTGLICSHPNGELDQPKVPVIYIYFVNYNKKYGYLTPMTSGNMVKNDTTKMKMHTR